jgi:biopolymer transport protein ExbD
MGFGGGSGKGVRSDINVTPLVDVCLVLLIIFMVMMPVIMRDITLEIPRKAEPNEDQMSEAVIVVQVEMDGTIKLNDKQVNKFQLAEELAATLKNKRDKIVFAGFADDLNYAEAVSVMDVIKGAGATKVALKMKDENKEGSAEGTQGSATPGQ